MTKKRARKVIVSSLVGLSLLLTFVLTVSAASSKFDCSYLNISCKGVNVSGHGTSYEYSDVVYATSGQELAVSNTSTGAFNLVTQLVDYSLNPITGEIAFEDTQFVKVPASGNYRVKVTCKDGSEKKRCTGRGSVSQ